LSTEQQENLEAALRRSPIPIGSSVSEQRRLLWERASARPAPADVTVAPAELGGVPAAEITVDVAVTLDLTPKVPHVFQNFYPILDEAADALDRAGKVLTAHLERRNTCEQQ
jgi:hypothetical protein